MQCFGVLRKFSKLLKLFTKNSNVQSNADERIKIEGNPNKVNTLDLLLTCTLLLLASALLYQVCAAILFFFGLVFSHVGSCSTQLYRLFFSFWLFSTFANWLWKSIFS